MTAMGWFLTADVGEFLAEAGEFLRAEPARNTVVLTVTENLRVKAASPSTATPGSGPDDTLFGWWRPPAVPGTQSPGPVGAVRVVGSVSMLTPEFPVLLSSGMSGQAAAELARDLAAAGRQVPGINAAQEAADAFAAVWADRTGDAITSAAGCACSGSVSSSGPHRNPRGQPGWPPNGTGICWPGGSTRSPARSATRPG